MRIVVLDGHTLNPGDNPWDPVGSIGEITVYDRTPPELVSERAREAEIVLTNKTVLDAGTLVLLPKLRYIGVLATGYNVVDIEAARSRGIPVTNIPEYGTDSVAQHVFALLLELTNRVALHDDAVRKGAWQRSGDFSFWRAPLRELAGLSMAIVGFGRIGRRVGELAHAFGMAVLAADPLRSAEPGYRPFEWVGVEEAFERGDVVSLNCPLTEQNRGLVSSAMLARMKRTALLINAARGPLVREQDLADALRGGVIAGAALDVVSREPLEPGNPLLGAPDLIVTPHIAWATLESRRRLMATAAENIRAFLRGAPINVVNRAGR